MSIVIPVFQNADTLATLHQEIGAALATLDVAPEFVFVDDASSDRSAEILGALQAQHSDIKVITNETNAGQQAAIRKGLRACSGDSVVVMDADLQDPPSAIPLLLAELWLGECQAVFATRVGRYQSDLRMLSSVIYRILMRQLARLPKGAGGFVAMTRVLADEIAQSPNTRFYLAGLVGCHATAVGAIPVARDFRRSGASTYTGRMRLATALSNILCVLKERWFHAAT
ncbi:glycosyltransferase family 2 protein [Hoeflea marina]|uniref:glycosyltransferase family 2 protein n=1 Tax=Hoeflea marina TaxID=274592 RepID=UPI001304F0EE|nr:glycosyltransferase family 2 protein [Hoeflea marina]